MIRRNCKLDERENVFCLKGKNTYSILFGYEVPDEEIRKNPRNPRISGVL